MAKDSVKGHLANQEFHKPCSVGRVDLWLENGPPGGSRTGSL